MVIPGLAPLDALEPHSQFLHQANRLYGINGFRENLVGFAFAEGIVNQGATGFKGIALPPEATVKNPANLIDVLFVLVEQDIAYHFIGASANRCYSAFSGNAEGRKEALGFLEVIGWFTFLHGFFVTENFVQVGGILWGEVSDCYSRGFYVHF